LLAADVFNRADDCFLPVLQAAAFGRCRAAREGKDNVRAESARALAGLHRKCISL
jgi:hypothetical protein